MPFIKMKRLYDSVRMTLVFLALFIIAGCVAQNQQSVKTPEEKTPPQKVVKIEAKQQLPRQVTSVSMETTPDGAQIKIQGNQKLVYTSIKQSFPFGIAVYLPETQIAQGLTPPVSTSSSVGDVMVTYADQEKTTAKVEILLKEDLEYEMAESGSALDVILSGGVPTVVVDEVKSEPSVQDKSQSMMPVSEKKELVVPSKTATMTDIAFSTLEGGKSDIVVTTNQPVKYDIIQGKDSKLYLNLYNTRIPERHKRPILTYYFKSAVESLMPIQMPGKKKNAKIEISIRDQVPYRVVQDQNTISLFFEPSTIEPPVFTKNKKKVASGIDVEVPEKVTQKTAVQEEVADVATSKEKSIEEQIFGPKKVYTGEKIKLDFYETDIKNVFRILRTVGGLNFAIDKNVEGKVTLTLENPVPWDQVLDLVLKMNNLGMKKEGNVIRIATLDTLKEEEKQVQDAIIAKKKTMEQKESFEPLVTEYIPINYSDAETDIKPHLSQILSADRGKLSVDKRTNMIIITDVQAKIDQAKEIIDRLDQVTPQIMIEAKVVEVTKDFSRELGVGLSLSENRTATSATADFTVALNHPISSPVNTGTFNFFRLFGSTWTSLNAQLSASESKGDVKVVSSPRILTLDNKSAKVKQGFEVGYEELDQNGGTTVKFKNVDLLLEVTPHVTPDKRIAMTVFLTKNDVDSYVAGVPTLSTNEAQTELLVNNNDTIVIAGIVKTNVNKTITGTPGLSQIPLVGRLFRTDLDVDERNELLIFITPSIVQLEQKRNVEPSN